MLIGEFQIVNWRGLLLYYWNSLIHKTLFWKNFFSRLDPNYLVIHFLGCPTNHPNVQSDAQESKYNKNNITSVAILLLLEVIMRRVIKKTLGCHAFHPAIKPIFSHNTCSRKGSKWQAMRQLEREWVGLYYLIYWFCGWQ